VIDNDGAGARQWQAVTIKRLPVSSGSVCFSNSANVRFGSKADIGLAPVDVRFTPESGHSLRLSECQLGPKADI
jgi:hypothetical protein